MTEDEQVQRLRNGRHLANAAAFLALAASCLISVPIGMRHRRELKAVNEELSGLQTSIVAIQERTRKAQSETIGVQTEIKRLLNTK